MDVEQFNAKQAAKGLTMPDNITNITLKDAAINERSASERVRGCGYLNIAGKSAEELNEMAIYIAEAQVAWLKAKNQLDEVIKREANA